MHNCVIIIFGASGDLAKRKLIPALYTMFAQGNFDKCWIVGAARDQTDMHAIIESAREFIEHAQDSKIEEFKHRALYQRLDFQKLEDFESLKKYVQQLEQVHNLSGNRLIYVAAAADFFCTITQHCAQAELAINKDKKAMPWHRIVYEKPFGKDLQSARAINACIAQHFQESQIYRIDHFLTKEVVGNIALVRFTNLVFEPLWNNRFIDYVQIMVDESIGIEGRGAYYDQYGALRDIVQNHILEILALVAMESPEWLHGEYIRAQRVKVLEKIKVVDVLLGQYQGYLEENQVTSQSNTETFAVAKLMIENPRWSGVPFYVKTGKHLEKKQTVIHVKFKQVDCLLAKHCPSESNMLTIEIAPEGKFSLRLNIKKPGVADEVMPVDMEFCHSCIFGAQTPESYQIIFEEIFKEDEAISVRFDEIEAAWRVIDEIKKIDLPLHLYERGSAGPTQLKDFEKKHGMRWQS